MTMSTLDVHLYDNIERTNEVPGQLWSDVTTVLGRMQLAPTVGPTGVMLAEFLWTLGHGTYPVADLTRLIGRANAHQALWVTIDRLERFGIARRFAPDTCQIMRYARPTSPSLSLIAEINSQIVIG